VGAAEAEAEAVEEEVVKVLPQGQPAAAAEQEYIF